MPTLRLKLVIVGDDRCGKTTLLCDFSNGVLPKAYSRAVWNDTAKFEVDQHKVELALWDTEGGPSGGIQERLRPLAYPDAHVVLIAFAVNNPDPLENIQKKWIKEVRHFLPETPIILVCCKVDLRNDRRALADLARNYHWPVSSDEGTVIAAKIGATKFLECSAKTGEGVNELFEAAVRVCMDAGAKDHKVRRTRFRRPDTSCIVC
ncbi:GTP-binding protein [Flagelloscypha sp. PMI_526]|nr:GTP-binding protein [Flagelloscypha sp. PMI_526]